MASKDRERRGWRGKGGGEDGARITVLMAHDAGVWVGEGLLL